MTVDPALATIIVAAIAAIASIVSAMISVRQRGKVNETHKQVTVNHHSSMKPTVLDHIDDVRQLVLAQGAQINALSRDFNEHVHESIEVRKRVDDIEERDQNINDPAAY